MTAQQARWEVAAATEIGAMHVREHLPNQDSSAVWAAPDATAAVAVVADGHGHHAHFRSDVGSALAAAITEELLVAAVGSGGNAVDPAIVAREVVAAWRDAVLAHVAEHPLRSDERLRGELVPYGTTLVAAVASGGRLGVLQVGDGDAVVVRTSGEVLRPLPEDPMSSDGVHTASLCQPDPLSSLRTTVLDLDDDPLALVLVTTDGLGKATPGRPDWWEQTGRTLAAALADAGPAGVRERLAAQVTEAAGLGGDDTTLAVLARA